VHVSMSVCVCVCVSESRLVVYFVTYISFILTHHHFYLCSYSLPHTLILSPPHTHTHSHTHAHTHTHTHTFLQTHTHTHTHTHSHSHSLTLTLTHTHSGTYDTKSKSGGSCGGTMRHDAEAAHGANAGLAVPRERLAKIHLRFPEMSYGDLWTLAAIVAVEEMGGMHVCACLCVYERERGCVYVCVYVYVYVCVWWRVDTGGDCRGGGDGWSVCVRERRGGDMKIERYCVCLSISAPFPPSIYSLHHTTLTHSIRPRCGLEPWSSRHGPQRLPRGRPPA
jgi:hypothetical protein